MNRRLNEGLLQLLAWTAGAFFALAPRVSAGSSIAQPCRAPHPEPRVIVTVTSLDGPHDRAAVQRAARETWGGIVRCYKELGQAKSGSVVLQLQISEHGKVTAVRRADAGRVTLNGEVSDCLAHVLRKKTMPTAPSASSATIQIQLAPGND